MYRLKSVIAILITLFLSFSLVFASNASPFAAGRIVSSTVLKKALPGIAKPDAAKVLATAGKYYKQAMAKADSFEKSNLSIVLTWIPDFSGKTKETAKAALYSDTATALTNYTNMKGVYLPLNCAIFALDPKNAVSAGNLASAIVTYSEDTLKNPISKSISKPEAKACADDAASVYEYALALCTANGILNSKAMPHLLNYGNLCLDMGAREKARSLFETALVIDKEFVPAKKCMAAYWLSVGNKSMAEKALQGGRIPAAVSTADKSILEVENKKTSVNASDPIPVIEQKIKAVSSLPQVIATDFFSDVNPEGAKEARIFVDSLNSQLKYTAPSYNYLSQYTSLDAFVYGGGYSALEVLEEELRKYEAEHSVTRTGFEPYRLSHLAPALYIDVDVANVPLSEQQFKENPEAIIFTMNPQQFTNPSDLFMQKYNTCVLMQKLSGYSSYFTKQFMEIDKIIYEDSQKIAPKYDGLLKTMDNELEKIEERKPIGFYMGIGDSHTAKENAEAQETNDELTVKKHKIHENYMPQMDNVVKSIWSDACNVANDRYSQKIKPQIEAMYADCMKNIMLISDPAVRQHMTDTLNRMIHSAICKSLGEAAEAYGIYRFRPYPNLCDCDLDEVDAAQKRLDDAYEASGKKKSEVQKKAMQEFKSGAIPENSPLYKKLETYTTTLDLFFMHGKISPLLSEVSYKINITKNFKESDIKNNFIKENLSLGAGFEFKITEDRMRNTTTYSGGISAGADAGIPHDNEKYSVGASTSLNGEMVIDGNGSLVSMDMGGSIEGSLSVGGTKYTAAYDTSIMRGSKLSAEVNRSFCYAHYEMEDDVSQFLPNNKLTLWKGEYKLGK